MGAGAGLRVGALGSPASGGLQSPMGSDPSTAGCVTPKQNKMKQCFSLEGVEVYTEACPHTGGTERCPPGGRTSCEAEGGGEQLSLPTGSAQGRRAASGGWLLPALSLLCRALGDRALCSEMDVQRVLSRPAPGRARALLGGPSLPTPVSTSLLGAALLGSASGGAPVGH